MDSVSYMLGSHMNALGRDLEMVASNIANANTLGFKKGAGGFQAILTTRIAPTADESARIAWPEFRGPKTDFSQGGISTTGRPLDVAINGPGFFVVDTPVGERYTRHGRIHMNAEGELMDVMGNRYASSSGSMRVPEGTVHISVDQSGQVLADGQAVGQLLVMEMPQLDALMPEDGGLYRNDGPAARPSLGSEVLQGAVEGSNVSVVFEMVHLADVMRAYETTSRVMKRMDNLTNQLIKAAA